MNNNRKQKNGLTLLIFLTAGFLIYSGNLMDYYLCDDFAWLNLTKKYSFYSGEGLFRPINGFLFYLCELIAPGVPCLHHVLNLLIHIFNAYLVFKIAENLIKFYEKSGETFYKPYFIAVLAGLLFLISPFHAEAVVWISGIGTVSAAFFVLLSFYFYLKFNDKQKKIFLFYSLISYSLSLFTYESGMMLPLLILLFELFYCDKPFHKINFKNTALFFLILAGYIVIRIIYFGELFGGNFTEKIQANFKFSFLLENFAYYTFRLFCFPTYNNYLVILMVIIVIATVTYFFIKSLVKHKTNLFILSLFVLISAYLLIIPVISLEICYTNFQGGRLIYLPFAFISIFMIIVLSDIFKKFIFYTILILFFCINLFYVSRENLYWHKASVISENIINEISKIDSCENLIIINLPDNLKGAYIFRYSTFDNAIIFKKYDKHFAVSNLIITHDINDEDDPVDVNFNKKSGTIIVSGLYLPYYILENNSSIFKIDKIIGNRISIFIKNSSPKTTILYYSKGHLNYLESVCNIK
ncbi:MAG: hypothetical protein HGB12_13530, partial [Bacteroidetes bacterium]|nr:hypothetical protein [Bacteroidota bacterium]